MPRNPARFLVPALIAVLFLVPALATARPHHEASGLSASERLEAGPGVLSKVRDFLSGLWAETGSILEPDGADPPHKLDGLEPRAYRRQRLWP